MVPNLIFGVRESILFFLVFVLGHTVVLLWKMPEDNTCSISVFSKRQIGNSRRGFIPHAHPSSNPLCSIKSLESPDPKSQGETQKPAWEEWLFLLNLNRLGGLQMSWRTNSFSFLRVSQITYHITWGWFGRLIINIMICFNDVASH